MTLQQIKELALDAQQRSTFTSDTYLLADAVFKLLSVVEKQGELINEVHNYLYWREDDLVGDDLIGDRKLTKIYHEVQKKIITTFVETREMLR